MRIISVSAFVFLTLALHASPTACHGAVTPALLPPSARCIYRVLKSSNAIRSVDIYDIDSDGSRLGFEYTFNGTGGRPTVSYVELVGGDFLGEKIPKEASQQAMVEGAKIESELHLSKKCHLQEGFDNLFPQPAARQLWRRIYPPENH